VIAGERPSALTTDVHRNPQQPDDEVCFFQAAALSSGCGPPWAGGATGVELAHNVRSPHEVAGILREAERPEESSAAPRPRWTRAAPRAPSPTPDGNVWEIARNPGSTIREDGTLRI